MKAKKGFKVIKEKEFEVLADVIFEGTDDVSPVETAQECLSEIKLIDNMLLLQRQKLLLQKCVVTKTGIERRPRGLTRVLDGLISQHLNNNSKSIGK